ncbi:MAG: ABC transporter ATP-binding protein [Chloroflexi bacterium]|jgi:ABC-2 type transport system ATP-binding protein|nr:ABC transporter ATP-binding protein [Anaerolineaceae bacterium]NMB88769.1 ABC transporter ATP-binding protein [Chloroflexota bacterium]
MAPIIEIQNLTKRFGSRTAVDGLTLEVEAGEIFGFVGPNGAGKTSAIRMMTTLLEPTGGEVRIDGYSVGKQARQVRQVIGYMPDLFGLYHNMKVWEYLDFFAACYRIPPGARRGLIDDLLELVDLSHRRDDVLDSLSRGMQQRLSLARTLVHDPKVLILDEPASGLDPRARVEIRELLVQLAGMGKTVFFSTHILADVVEICTRVGILEAGKLVAMGELETLQQQVMPRRKLEITVLGAAGPAQAVLEQVPAISNVQITGQPNGKTRLELEFSGDDDALSQVLAALVEHGIPVIHFSADSRDLEAVFMRATKGLVT